IILWYPGHLLASFDAQVAFVGNNVVDLKWDYFSSTFEYYQVLRDGFEIARILDSQVTFYRDATASKGESHVYQVCRAYPGGLHCSEVLTAKAGEVEGIIYHDITWEDDEYELYAMCR
ncbi:MAG: hypothetical protein JRG75_08050, partial [Deltaproteobacteria bacterium]|nr:hypothetical protein [Deltaproteobacteria bacterium]